MKSDGEFRIREVCLLFKRCHGRSQIDMKLTLLTLLLIGIAGVELSAAPKECLFTDMRFRRGFLLSYPDSSKGRAAQAVLDLECPDNTPIWRLCQWGTKYSLAKATLQSFTNGDVAYENRGKKVLVGAERSENRDLILQVNGGAEYGPRVRKRGESWPHLLVEQRAVTIYRLDELKELRFKLSLRLLHCENHMTSENCNPQLHAAQFLMFLVVRNINRQSRDFNNHFWFGVPFFDSRHDIPRRYMAKDTGKPDATGKFIYSIDGAEVNGAPMVKGQWVTAQKDLLPHIKDGLQEAVRRGYLLNSELADYAVVGMNLGWEIPGAFDAAMQIRDFNISATIRD